MNHLDRILPFIVRESARVIGSMWQAASSRKRSSSRKTKRETRKGTRKETRRGEAQIVVPSHHGSPSVDWVSRGRPMVLVSVRWVAAAACASLLSGCMLAATPKVRSGSIKTDSYVATDARQRVVTSVGVGNFSRPGRADPNQIICAEPSPDAAAAIASQLGGALSVIGRGTGSFSASHAQSLVQLAERTASIQLLRDKMYQTCLAYANGAVTGTTYTLIMAQLDQTIVTLLLGETAAGAFGRSGAAARTSAEGTVQGTLVSLPAGSQDLDDAADEVSAAQGDLNKKLAARDAASTACDDAKKTDAASAPTSEACLADDKAKTAVAQAQGKLDAMLKLLRAEVDTAVTGAAKGEAARGVGGLTVEPTPEIARELVQMQDNFLFTDGTASFLPTCLVELASQIENGSTLSQSLDTLIANVDVARAELEERSRSVRLQRAGSTAYDTAVADQSVADTNLQTAQKQLESFISAMTPKALSSADAASSPQRDLFAQLKAERIANPEIGLADLVSAAYQAQGQTKLAQLCTRYLPGYLVQAGKNSQSIRKQRLQLQQTVALAHATARAEEARLALYSGFQASLAACEAIKGADEEKRPCRAAVVAVLDRSGGAGGTPQVRQAANKSASKSLVRDKGKSQTSVSAPRPVSSKPLPATEVAAVTLPPG